MDLAPSSKAASDDDETNQCHKYIVNDTLQAVLESNGNGNYSDLSDESSVAII